MSKFDWPKADRPAERDAGSVVGIADHEYLEDLKPKRKREPTDRLSPTERDALLARSERIRLAALAKKKERLARLKTGEVSRTRE